MNVLKIVFQGLLLLAFAAFLRWSTRQVVLKKRPPINPLYSSLAYVAVIILFGFLYIINFPAFIGTTHPDVIAAKSLSRSECRQASEKGSVAMWTWNNQDLHKEYTKSYGSSAFTSQLFNALLFGSGTMATVMPFIFQLIAAVAYKYFSREHKLGSIYPLKHQGLSLPFVFAITITSIVIFGTFHLEADQDRTHLCLLFSGHWFTYFFTTLFGVQALVHFAASSGLFSTYTALYAGYFVLCQTLFFRVLNITQQFYHDSEEARGGLSRAMGYSPFVFGVFLLVEWFNWNRYQTEKATRDEAKKTLNGLPDELKTILKKAGIKKSVLLDSDVMGQVQQNYVDYVTSLKAPAAAAAPSTPVKATVSQGASLPPPAPPAPQTPIEVRNAPLPPPPTPTAKKSATDLPPPPQFDADALPQPLPSSSDIQLPPPLVTSFEVSKKPDARSLVDAMQKLKKVTPGQKPIKVEENKLYNMLVTGLDRVRAAVEVEEEEGASSGTDEDWN
ncbi:xin actin-binding repeat-containing protein 2-like [Planoprotostelium fungivorum]|uniref:Xin actin-binding repeat-containing protein 2-like n=1 Tax=Planoprotostelium fungivorum TaxID=1890364 RepID=A0A2P6MT45_9EUKA|nr:xin actin-binding repeat-containing protein 2-like [Planoprotostelium fungivorum]